ncbi:putative transmembrane protein [Toxoplasma gondii MAS]|uniref:Putative transmembrane protein n=1 Tax=Toxoplasma gondii MAS TaxID=943118 RepID=A0A086QAT4_TOXGO|nr:putative transmembrane protein [Toxoplasma gondii MAS]
MHTVDMYSRGALPRLNGCIELFIFFSMELHIYIYIYICVYVHGSIRPIIYIYIYICVCIKVYVYSYTYMCRQEFQNISFACTENVNFSLKDLLCFSMRFLSIFFGGWPLFRKGVFQEKRRFSGCMRKPGSAFARVCFGCMQEPVEFCQLARSVSSIAPRLPHAKEIWSCGVRKCE